MKKISICFVLALFLYSNHSMAQSLNATEPTKHINTNGNAKMWVTPDRARLFLGVETQEETIDEARKENATTINRIMTELKSLKIKEMLVQSPTYNVAFIKEDERTAKIQLRIPKIIGYRVTQKFTVLIRNDDITTLSKNSSLVLDTALQNGINIIQQDIMFFKEDSSQEKEEALKLAIKDAMSRAKVIAETAGVTIKEYTMIDSTFFMGNRYNQFAQLSQSSSPVVSEGTASTVIAAKIPVEASVSLSCILE